jgi:nucleoporin NDC1
MWGVLVRQGLLLLGLDLRVLRARGKAALGPPAPPPPAPTPVPKPAPTTSHTPLLKKPILRSSQSQPSGSGFSPLTAILDTFASDSKLSMAVEVVGEKGVATGVSRVGEVVEKFGVAVGTGKGKEVSASTTTNTIGTNLHKLYLSLLSQTKTKLHGLINMYTPPLIPVLLLAGHGVIEDAVGWAGEWWEGERLGKVVEGALPRRELDVLVIGGTSSSSLFCVVLFFGG